MKERPILFSAPMVRAILDGTKTQTRRVAKGVAAVHPVTGEPLAKLDSAGPRVPCPYGQPGNRLWARETWRIGSWSEDTGSIAIDYQADGHSRREWLEVPDGEDFRRYWQQSTDDAIKAHGDQDRYVWKPGQSPCRWRPSIHMPRWASRITLEVTGVRVERLQQISEDDALAEGCSSTAVVHEDGEDYSGHYASEEYQDLWESINGPGSWDANPWVWVVEYKRI